MKVVVITGSTRGIGLGLADAFLARGCCVVVSSRTVEAVSDAVEQLSTRHDPAQIFGHPCDVTDFQQVQALWDAAVAHLSRVDIWINNAGVAHAQTAFWDYDPDLLAAVVHTNVIGALYGARVALAGMRAQGAGALYNVEGLGSDGRYIEGLALYGTTKRALAYLTDALVREVKGTPLVVGALRPGMVVTDLLVGQYRDRPNEWARARRVFNLLADHVETVAPWFADHVLANERSGARFKWLTTPRLIGRFLAAPFAKRDLFSPGEPDR
ncbi:MAG: SDR family oxidoreductase [Anaerolineae bacterium]|nr:SDR family oxidoreductase [Anaerolineae bacterium]